MSISCATRMDRGGCWLLKRRDSWLRSTTIGRLLRCSYGRKGCVSHIWMCHSRWSRRKEVLKVHKGLEAFAPYSACFRQSVRLWRVRTAFQRLDGLCVLGVSNSCAKHYLLPRSASLPTVGTRFDELGGSISKISVAFSSPSPL